MKTYDLTGNQISQESSIYNSYNITLIGNNNVYVHTLMSQISVIDCLTENKHITICNEFGFKNTIFRKHIVKITEVK